MSYKCDRCGAMVSGLDSEHKCLCTAPADRFYKEKAIGGHDVCHICAAHCVAIEDLERDKAALEARCRELERKVHLACNQFENITVAETLEIAKDRAHGGVAFTMETPAKPFISQEALRLQYGVTPMETPAEPLHMVAVEDGEIWVYHEGCKCQVCKGEAAYRARTKKNRSVEQTTKGKR